MSRFESREALAGKIAWEGGNWAALEYGIDADDMPEGDEELTAAWAALDQAFKQAGDAWDVVEALLPEIEGM